MSSEPAEELTSFSKELSDWLKSSNTKTLAGLEEVFGPRSFAVAVVVLMFLPALPLPTGGISHVFELVVIILSAQMVVGRHTMWVPERWRTRPLGERMLTKALPFMVKRIEWFEKISKPRLAGLMGSKVAGRLYGVGFMIFAAFALLAPPFSGLDTLPSMGAVVLALSLLFTDAVLALLGLVLGGVGIVLIFTLGVAAYEVVTRFFT